MKCRIVTYRLTEIYSHVSRLLSDVSYFDEYRTKKALKYVKRMLPLFRVVVKLCSTTYEIFSLPIMRASLNFTHIKWKVFTAWKWNWRNYLGNLYCLSCNVCIALNIITEIYSDASRSLSDVSYFDEYRTKKAFKYVKRMLQLFHAVKSCSTDRLFTILWMLFFLQSNFTGYIKIVKYKWKNRSHLWPLTLKPFRCPR